MHEGKGASDEMVPQTREPAGAFRGQRIDVATHGVDEHHLAHAFEHRVAARSPVLRFRRGLAHELCDPVLAMVSAQMHESR